MTLNSQFQYHRGINKSHTDFSLLSALTIQAQQWSSEQNWSAS